MTSRFQTVMNDLELAAKKLEISIEDAVLILLGKHPTHQVTAKPLAQVNTGSPNAPSTSGPVAASVAAQNQAAAASTGVGSNGSTGEEENTGEAKEE